MPLQNLILDLGGVIIDLDFNRLAAAFKSLGISDFGELYSKAKQDHLFDDFEKGALSPDQFRDRVRANLPGGVSDEQIDFAWNQILAGLPKDRLDFIRRLKRHYTVYLLSNTNPIHIAAFTKYADDAYGVGYFTETFDKIYYSSDVKLRKPDREIYELVLNENKLNLNETLFIDDNVVNIEGALKVGLPSELLHIEAGDKLEEKYQYLLQ